MSQQEFKNMPWNFYASFYVLLLFSLVIGFNEHYPAKGLEYISYGLYLLGCYIWIDWVFFVERQ